MKSVNNTGILQEAQFNKQEILRLLAERKRDFLEIGRLLAECRERDYWKSIGAYKNFKDYIKRDPDLKEKVSYTYAQRLINIHESSASPGFPSRERVINMGVSKMWFLVPSIKRGRLNEELWNKAENQSAEKLKEALGYKSLEAPVPTIGEESHRHRKIQKIIMELGRNLGKYPELEYPSRDRKHKFDVVWRRKEFEHPREVTHVFEIEIKWSKVGIEHALGNLLHAWKTEDKPLPFLIVPNPEDRDRAKQIASTFGEILGILTILTEEEIDRCDSSLSYIMGLLKLEPIETIP